MWSITKPGETLTMILPPVCPHNMLHFSWVVAAQSLRHVWLFATPWTTVCQTPLSCTISQGLLKFMSIEGLPCWLSGEEPTCQCRRHRRCSSIPGSEGPPWRRIMATSYNTLVWKIPRTEDLEGYSPWGLKELDMTEATEHACMSIELVMLSNLLILCCLLLLLPSLLPIFPLLFAMHIFLPFHTLHGVL